MRSLAWITAVSLFGSAPALAEDEPKVLEPNGAWTLDYGDERCSLIRTFGTGRDALKLQIDSYGSSTGFRMVLAGRTMPRALAAAGEIRYGFLFEPVERERVMSLHGMAGGVPSVSFSMAFDPRPPKSDAAEVSGAQAPVIGVESAAAGAEFERQSSGIVVEFSKRNRVQLKLGPMRAPLEAMRECVDNLMEHWSLDPEQQRALSRMLAPDLSTVRRLQARYPVLMSAEGRSAFVPVRIMVDASGQATQCVVQIPSVDPVFQEAVCDGFAKRFSPALDKDGRPVASVFQASVIYNQEF